jgi:hypothetical protein
MLIGLIDFPSLAEYEVYRAKLAVHPLHKKNVEVLESTGALLSIHRSLVQRVTPRRSKGYEISDASTIRYSRL